MQFICTLSSTYLDETKPHRLNALNLDLNLDLDTHNNTWRLRHEPNQTLANAPTKPQQGEKKTVCFLERIDLLRGAATAQ